MKEKMFDRFGVEIKCHGSVFKFRVFDPLVEALPESDKYKRTVANIQGRRNTPIDSDDLVGEFHLGIAVALKKVKTNIGDPIEYLIQYGKRAVQMAVRKECNRKYIQECVECGHKRAYDQRPCKCKAKSFILHARFSLLKYDHEEILADGARRAKRVVDGDSDT